MNGNERTMRSAITLGLGIMIAAAAPGVLAQVNPAAPNSGKSALPGGAKPAQQPAKPAPKPAPPVATKPAPPAAKPAAPAATTAAPAPAKPAAKSPAEP